MQAAASSSIASASQILSSDMASVKLGIEAFVEGLMCHDKKLTVLKTLQVSLICTHLSCMLHSWYQLLLLLNLVLILVHIQTHTDALITC